MQAIEVKYLPVTDTKPSRFKATCSAGSVTQSYNYEHQSEGNALEVATALANKIGWLDSCILEGGQLKNGNFVFVLIRKEV